MRTFEVTAKNLKKNIQVSVGEADRIYMPPFNAFNSTVRFEVREGKKCLYLSDYSYKNWGPELAKFVGNRVKKGNVGIEITDESWDMVQQIKTEMADRQEILADQFEKEAANQSVWYEMYQFLDWGDYSINMEREIIVYRNPMEKWGEKDPIRVTTYQLWNKRIGEKEVKWDDDFKKNGGVEGKNSVKISKELAEEWISFYNEAIAKEQKMENEKEMKRVKKEEERKAEREAKFAEAKETGKPVLLYSTFLSHNDIPRQYRNDQSDMGHLNSYAMPDGTIKETFSHAY